MLEGIAAGRRGLDVYASDRNAEDRLADDVRSSAPSLLVNELENDGVVRSPAPSRDVRSGAATEPSRELLYDERCLAPVGPWPPSPPYGWRGGG